MSGKPTVKDVAKYAGVSASTVSRVITGRIPVNEDKRKKVMEAVKALNYKTCFSARALVDSRTDTIGLIIDRTPSKSLNNAFFIEIIEAITSKLGEYGKYVCLVFDAQGKEDEINSFILSGRVDGVIKLTSLKNDRILRLLSDLSVPTVVVGKSFEKSVTSVDNDNVSAMEEAVSHLLVQGKKKIAFVSGSDKYFVSEDRLEGYKRALMRTGMKFSKADIYQIEFSFEAAFELAEKLIERGYDAAACTDDVFAYAIAKLAKEKGCDFSVVGFNNSFLSYMTDLEISSVDIGVKKLGYTASELIISKLRGEDVEDVLIDTNLIVR